MINEKSKNFMRTNRLFHANLTKSEINENKTEVQKNGRTAIEQDWTDQDLVNFVWRARWLDCKCLRSPKKHLFAVWILWILRCISRLTSFVDVIRDPRYTNSLTTSKCFATFCPTSRIPGRNHIFCISNNK
jgi:hypothetical protein